MRISRWLVTTLTLLLLAVFGYWEWKQRSVPGPLHASHAAVVKLQGNAGCAVCHGKGQTDVAEACWVCHADIKRQTDQHLGLHGKLPTEVSTRACTFCHSEHNGDHVKLVSDRSFHAAGFAEVQSFNHSKITAFSLKQKHDALACKQCHPAADASFLKQDQTRFLGLTQQCQTCHKDVHEGTFGPDCESCHGQAKPLKQADGFVHAKDFPLVGGHANRACADCHEKTGPTAVATLKLHSASVRACGECHDSPHRAGMITAIARSLGKSESAACITCHGRDDASFLYPVARMSNADHAATGYRLGVPHDKVECQSCHPQIGKRIAIGKVSTLKTQFAAQYPSHTQSACGDCHDSPHQAGMIKSIASKRGIVESESCSVCHGVSDPSFLTAGTTMTAADHAATGFVLDLPHDKVQCAACHKEMGKRPPLARGSDLAQRFQQLYPGRAQTACESCHADVHVGQFKHSSSQGKCVACHAITQFKPSNFDLVSHDKTRFVLTGSHRATSCVECHKLEGKTQRFVPTASQCSACHADVHRGEFDQPGRAKVVSGNEGCARCHLTTQFSQVTWKPQDHLTWTSFNLKGAHAKAACIDCHVLQSQADQHGRSFGIAPSACSSCHADPHLGQFTQNGATDCARCHTEEQKFTVSTFDHQKDSRFKLDDIHVKLECAACHREYTAGSAEKAVRYRPLGTQCIDCHDPGMLKTKEQR